MIIHKIRERKERIKDGCDVLADFDYCACSA